MIKLFKNEIEDTYIQQNFIDLEKAFNNEPLLKGAFKFFEISLSASSYPSLVDYTHSLGFVPKDAIVTSSKGSSYVMEYAKFTLQRIYITIQGPCVLRLFLGTYSEGKII